MSIKDELSEELKDAMRARDRVRLDAIRQINSEIGRKTTEPGFRGPADDDLYREVIAAYTRKMGKAVEEYEGYGERGAETAAKLRAEIEFLQRWLPEAPSDEEVAAVVDRAIAELGVEDPKQAGRVIGHVMKSNPGLDGATVNRVVRERLGA